MDISRTRVYTLEEFEDYIAQPENADRLFELINGEIVEKMPSNPSASEIAQLIAFFIRLFLREQGIAGHVTDGQGGYMVNGQPYAPDVAYISVERQAELARTGYNPLPPQLAVEVESPSTAASERRLRTKVYHYLAAGAVVWIVYPETREIEIQSPDKAPRTLTESEIIDGGDVLPGFTLPLKELFTPLGD